MKIDYKNKFTDKEIELFERIKMCLMLNELYNRYKDKDYEKNMLETYINSFQLRQIYIAYIHVVIETLNSFRNDNIYNKYLLKLDKILDININNNKISIILKNFRNKTFHPQQKSFSNTKELFNMSFDNLDEECEKIIVIFKEIYKCFIDNKDKMINAYFGFYNSKFYSRLKKEGEFND